MLFLPTANCQLQTFRLVFVLPRSTDSQQRTEQAATPIWYASLSQQLKRLAKPVLQQKKQGLFSITLQAPVPAPVFACQTQTPWVYWHRPSEDHKLMGLGQVAMLVAEGDDRFIQLQDQYGALQQHWTHISQGKIKSQPRAFLGYGFDTQQSAHPLWRGFPDSQLFIPGLLIEWQGERCNLTFTCRSDKVKDVNLTIMNWLELAQRAARSDAADIASAPSLKHLQHEPAESVWLDRVEQAKQTIDTGKLDKIVLSRRIRTQADEAISLTHLLPALEQKYPGCTLLAMNFGAASLVAATPERLFKVRMGEVTADALAGTLAADDRLPRLDMQEYEHAPVVKAIERAMTPLCEHLEFPRQPKRMLLGNLQHFWTPVKGRLKNKVSLFQLLHNLHPTPAVGGVPTTQACDWIRQQETWRGWYTGGFGWIGDNREGDIVVLLRCALIDGKHAELFAGAGITSVSNPADELNETRMKFDAMLGALEGL